MAYVKPSSADSDLNSAYRDGQHKIVVTDSTAPYEDRKVGLTKGGYGVRYRVRGDSDGADNALFDIEILDAFPAATIIGGTSGAVDSEFGIQYDSDAEAWTRDEDSDTATSVTVGGYRFSSI